MKERIDKFMNAVREKYPNNGLAWGNLYGELSDLCKEDDRKELTKQWGEYHQEIKLAKWDDAFMELVINGAKVNEWENTIYTDATGAFTTNYVDVKNNIIQRMQSRGVIDPQKLIK